MMSAQTNLVHFDRSLVGVAAVADTAGEAVAGRWEADDSEWEALGDMASVGRHPWISLGAHLRTVAAAGTAAQRIAELLA